MYLEVKREQRTSVGEIGRLELAKPRIWRKDGRGGGWEGGDWGGGGQDPRVPGGGGRGLQVDHGRRSVLPKFTDSGGVTGRYIRG